jgi:hypothetical protein
MSSAVCNYEAYRRGPHAWMLGRLVVPASRLGEFESARADLTQAEPAAPWHVSALVGPDIQGDIEAVLAFGAFASAAARPVVVDAWEARVQSQDDIFRIAARLPGRVRASFEIPVQGDTRAARPALLEAIFHAGATAKARTGGLTPAAIPTVAEVAGFLWDCARARVPFKATAGLHHRVRGEYRLTYAADSPTGVMHGFLNVLVAAALARREASSLADPAKTDVPAVLTAVIEEHDRDAFAVRADTVRWRDVVLDASELGDTRAGFALSFGSCSFDEPVNELNAAGLPH